MTQEAHPPAPKELLRLRVLYNLGASKMHQTPAPEPAGDGFGARLLKETVSEPLSEAQVVEELAKRLSALRSNIKKGTLSEPTSRAEGGAASEPKSKMGGGDPTEPMRKLELIEGPALVLIAGLLSKYPKIGDDLKGEAKKYLVGDESGTSETVPAREVTPEEVLRRHREVTTDSMDARTRYNLACYYAAQDSSENEPIALAHLEYALETAELTDWAERDPALQSLKSHPRFLALIAKAARKPALPLARLEIIGPKHAATLESAGIVTIDELERATATKTACKTLANRTKISPLLVGRWGSALGLFQIPGVAEDQVNLLVRGSVDSVDILKAQTESELAQLLADVAAVGEELPAPTKDEVKAWIEHVKSGGKGKRAPSQG